MKFLVYVLAVWRLSHLLVRESGPGYVFERIREASGVDHDSTGTPVSQRNSYTPLHCVLCTSVYVSVVLYVVPQWVRDLLAASGAAILVQTMYEELDDTE